MSEIQEQELKLLFERRNKSYSKISAVILNKLRSSVLAGIYDYFVERHEVDEKRILTWQQVEYITQHDFIIVSGVIKHEVGSYVNVDGSDVLITAEMGPIHRAVRVGIPFNRTFDTPENIKEFLKLRDQESHIENEAAVQWLRQQLGIEEDAENEQMQEVDFNFDKLTEEQQSSLVVPTIKAGKLH